ncbi:hypothetical protein ACEWPB_15615 [Priestia megaterium]|uniref:hypothetical protein n=1 Tax=Priestia megaterium TaxID=1404 RepID=UPI0035C9F8D8
MIVKFNSKKQVKHLKSILEMVKNGQDPSKKQRFVNDLLKVISESEQKLLISKQKKTSGFWKSYRTKYKSVSFFITSLLLSVLISTYLIGPFVFQFMGNNIPYLVVIGIAVSFLFGIWGIVDNLALGFGKNIDDVEEEELITSVRGFATPVQRAIYAGAIVIFFLSFTYLIVNPDDLIAQVSKEKGDIHIVTYYKNFPNFATVFALVIAILAVVDQNIQSDVSQHNATAKLIRLVKNKK